MQKYKTIDIFNPSNMTIIDNIKGFIVEGKNIWKSADIYSLSQLREEGSFAKLDVETGRPIGEFIEEGEVITYKVTVSNGEITKEYMFDIEFRDRKF